MFAKKLLLAFVASVMLLNTGCCAFWDRWCNRPQYQAAQHCPPCPTACPPGCVPAFSSPVMPVPPSGPGAPTNWQRCP